MATPRKTIWTLEPHSKGKHLVLQAYLKAWLPIISSWNKRILFIDGFAGPGVYEHGEDGSPIIALQTFQQHANLKHTDFEITFYFIEKDEARKENLNSLVDQLKPTLPGSFHIHIEQSRFDESLTDALDEIDAQNQRLAPCFAMIDPFSVSDTPMSLIERILRNNASEVYISVMYEWINRFKEHENFEKHLDSLFGCVEWRNGIEINNSGERKTFLFNLYKSQLKKAGAKYVVHFELFESNRLVYAIFFGTKHLTGCDRMKQAIWKVAPFGDFAFRGTHSEQLTLSLEFSDFTPLIRAIQTKFEGKGWIDIQQILDYVMSDETDFHSAQVKTKALRQMEEKGLIEIDESSRKRKKSYPTGTKLRIV
ncbi:MAG: three-Cys-motif partner protein TcmP [Gammaproteobacteria bacterium]|nr:three-Cys-motif partner protein TcmP [Gammaproteobacteria bacterium]